jgi:hypothetical protein
MDKIKDTKKEYRLSFYESGYIIPEEYERREFVKEDSLRIAELYNNMFLTKEEMNGIEFRGCMGIHKPKDK